MISWNNLIITCPKKEGRKKRGDSLLFNGLQYFKWSLSNFMCSCLWPLGLITVCVAGICDSSCGGCEWHRIGGRAGGGSLNPYLASSLWCCWRSIFARRFSATTIFSQVGRRENHPDSIHEIVRSAQLLTYFLAHQDSERKQVLLSFEEKVFLVKCDSRYIFLS